MSRPPGIEIGDGSYPQDQRYLSQNRPLTPRRSAIARPHVPPPIRVVRYPSRLAMMEPAPSPSPQSARMRSAIMSNMHVRSAALHRSIQLLDQRLMGQERPPVLGPLISPDRVTHRRFIQHRRTQTTGSDIHPAYLQRYINALPPVNTRAGNDQDPRSPVVPTYGINGYWDFRSPGEDPFHFARQHSVSPGRSALERDFHGLHVSHQQSIPLRPPPPPPQRRIQMVHDAPNVYSPGRDAFSHPATYQGHSSRRMPVVERLNHVHYGPQGTVSDVNTHRSGPAAAIACPSPGGVPGLES
ncbi:hypothetical protein ACHAPJ_009640 [Fusarium lateritium]